MKAQKIGTTDAKILTDFVHANVQVGLTLYTEENKGYKCLLRVFHNHDSEKHFAKEFVKVMAYNNGIESVWAVLKRGYVSNFHHLSFKYLQRFADEFSFRLNEGNVEQDTINRMKSRALPVNIKN